MEIICTKKEFAQLIRACDKITEGYHGCGDCAMKAFCTAEGHTVEDLVKIRLTLSCREDTNE